MDPSILSGLGAALGFAALHLTHDQVFLPYGGFGCLCPPLGAVAVLLFCMPNAPASQPKAVIGAHIIAGLVGYAVVNFANMGAYAEATAVVLTITLMSMFKMVHPPAGAYAFLYANKKMGLQGIFAPGLAGCFVLIAVQQVFLTLTASKKPVAAAGGSKTKKA
mmetsp:Transcript_29361/g.41081  ORF Transcript_29361/g.41081 Transcript_29361/m.41081 type:complete len:163 (+) Transcript_29361:113-601(+)